MTTRVKSVPVHLDITTQRFLQSLKDAVEEMQGQNTLLPRTPSNLQVTPQPGGNNIVFTVSDADSYQLFAGNTPDFTQAKIIELGRTNQYSDNVGTGGVDRYYWVRGVRAASGAFSTLVGPIKGTTLALGTPATAAPVVPAGDRYYLDEAAQTTVIVDQTRARLKN